MFAFVAAILDNTRRGGAGRAVVDNKMAKWGEGAGGAKRNFPSPSLSLPLPLPRFLLSPSRTRERAPQISKMAPD